MYFKILGCCKIVVLFPVQLCGEDIHVINLKVNHVLGNNRL